MKFVLIHGSFGHPGEHWFPIVKKSLQTIGQVVYVPSLPCEDWDEMTTLGPESVPKKQSLKTWFTAFEDILPKLSKTDKLCFVGQSLGPLFILHLVEKYQLHLDSAIFCCPFFSNLGKFWQVDLANKTFYKKDFDFRLLKKLIPTSFVLYSDTDPYVENKHSLEFAKNLNSVPILVRSVGHINSVDNAPLLFELCKTRISK